MSTWEQFRAWLAYRRDMNHNLWLRVTGRCVGCRQRHGHHKLGCSHRPGKGLTLSMVWKQR
jgi:hypothetical protein